MKTQVYLALYKGKRDGKWYQPSVFQARLCDWLIRKLTKGIYSHCEIAFERSESLYSCYSSSIRDGGVRSKIMPLPADKWDLIPIPNNLQFENELINRIIAYYDLTKNARYDWFGAIGIVFGIPHDCSKFFCSEWCMNAISNSNEGWRFSPNDLAAIFKKNTQPK